MTPELYATQEAYKLVTEEGMSFREAYAQVKRELP
jgi:argininosuccinate lyase